MTKKGFTLDLAINKTSWTAYYERVDSIVIKRRIGADDGIEVTETIEVRDGEHEQG